MQVRLQPAGHVLGSAYVELELSEGSDVQRVVFSGDLGAPHSPLLPDLVPPERADLLILESTYGDRRHEDRAHRRERLQAAIERALADQGTVLIPSFSIGRTQELLFELEEILHEKREAAEASGTPVEAPEQARDGDPDIDWPQLPSSSTRRSPAASLPRTRSCRLLGRRRPSSPGGRPQAAVVQAAHHRRQP